MALIFVCFLFLGVESVTGCLRTSTASHSGGEIPITTTEVSTTVITTTTTTTTRAPCEQKENLALFYKQEDVNFLFPNSKPVSSCMDCDGGQAEYYKSATLDIPTIDTTAEIGTMTTNICPDYCVCNVNDECFRPTPSTTVRFCPYCSDGTCGTYVFIRSGSLQSTTTTTVYTAEAQEDSPLYKPFTDPSYINAKSIGCVNCSPTSCSG